MNYLDWLGLFFWILFVFIQLPYKNGQPDWLIWIFEHIKCCFKNTASNKPENPIQYVLGLLFQNIFGIIWFCLYSLLSASIFLLWKNVDYFDEWYETTFWAVLLGNLLLQKIWVFIFFGENKYYSSCTLEKKHLDNKGTIKKVYKVPTILRVILSLFDIVLILITSWFCVVMLALFADSTARTLGIVVFCLYSAWITIATVLNLTVLIYIIIKNDKIMK